MIREQMERKLSDALLLAHLEVIDESGNHRVPAGAESHFKLVLVSEDFDGLKLIQRHRVVNRILREELGRHIHALSIHTYTQAEWRDKRGEAPMSPPCSGAEDKSVV